MAACTSSSGQDQFLKDMQVLKEREDKVELKVTGDFYTVEYMRDVMKVPEPLG